jgi:hypothetical protein
MSSPLSIQQLISAPKRCHGLGHVRTFISLLWTTGSDVGWLRDVTLAVWQKLHALPNSLVDTDMALLVIKDFKSYSTAEMLGAPWVKLSSIID